ncbi:hypothetical protein LEP1GSC133_4503 [Leptospira borgpetersenii serovar Pomona str. 200901868]|uniref:Uncharacterized protein n=1 Tax=Leptospira borgpetersenii serovar Pomona str. 200901868 TaxID=1192866 RepID=M6VY47_LEPBO|nr:hypothetical protein LEP1GSC133_4503 [Leptospira borgpetersenii serovar Pomona str. 200901868]
MTMGHGGGATGEPHTGLGSSGAYGSPSDHGPLQSGSSSGSFGPDGKPTGGRQLSAADVAEFKADWRKESPAQTDANIAGLKAAGYDTSGLEKFVNDYRNRPVANNSQGATPTVQTTQPHSTNQGPRILTNVYNTVVGGAKDLWNKTFGGGSPQGVYNSSGIEAGMDKVLASKAAYDPGYEQNGANWTAGTLPDGQKYSNISYTETKDANGNSVYEKVYRKYNADGTYTVAGTEASKSAAFNAAKNNDDFRRFTSCNMVNHEISKSFGAESPFMQGKKQYYAGEIYTNLQNGKYDTDTHQYRAVGFEDAEKNASRGGLSIAANNKHIVTLTGGYTGTQGKASNLNIFQGGGAGVGSMTIGKGFERPNNDAYFTNGKKLQYYVWEKK